MYNLDDVYGRRETAKITSDFLFFSSKINHTKIEKFLLFTANTERLLLTSFPGITHGNEAVGKVPL